MTETWVTDAWVLVGLGNPGPAYSSHRHNVGRMVADLVAERIGAGWRSAARLRSRIAEGRVGLPPGVRLIIAEPRSYMNETGGPVHSVLEYYKVPPANLVVVHDELDIPYGTLRLKLGGGDNGHNGLRSLRRSLGTGDFYRVRVGIGRPPGRQDPADFVLSPFTVAERKELAYEIDRAADAVEALVIDGLVSAQNTFHG